MRRAVQIPDTDEPFFERRTEPARAAPTEVSFGPFRLLPTQFLLLEGDKPVPLGSRALEILIVLLERPGELVSKQELMARVWPNVFVGPANLTVHISALRRTLRDGRDGNRFIINIPGRGYKFVASVAAARHQKTPLAIVSRKAPELEGHLQTNLVNRSSRALGPTDARRSCIAPRFASLGHTRKHRPIPTEPRRVSMSEIKDAGAIDQSRRQLLATATTGIAAAGVASVLPSQLTAAPAGDAIRPFRIDVPDEQLADLRRRIAATKWPDKEQVPDTTQGVQLVTMQQLVQHWANHDWRKVEARLNALPNFITEIDGLDIHFIHVRSKHENALPMIVTHGWPGSMIEQLKIIDPLTDPTAHGATAADAFHLVIPSLPGYGFSGKPTAPGWNPPRIAKAWAVLMQRLGYTQYVAQGGDWGNAVTEFMAVQQPPGLLGIHTNMPATVPAEINKSLAEGKPPAGLSTRRAQCVEPARLLQQERPGLRDRDEQPPADALRACGFAGRPRGVDDRPRRPQPEDDRPRLRRPKRGSDAGRCPRQRHALLADEHRDLVGAPLLGQRAPSDGRLLRPAGHQDPRRRERLSRRDLRRAAELGGAGVSEAHPLQQGFPRAATSRRGSSRSFSSRRCARRSNRCEQSELKERSAAAPLSSRDADRDCKPGPRRRNPAKSCDEKRAMNTTRAAERVDHDRTGSWKGPRWALLQRVPPACCPSQSPATPVRRCGVRDAQSEEGRGSPVRRDCGPAHKSSGACAGPRSGLPHSTSRGRQRPQGARVQERRPGLFHSSRRRDQDQRVPGGSREA